MIGPDERVADLYEISLAIEPKADLEATVHNALSTYVRKLDCAEGAVLKRSSDGESYEPIVTTPSASIAEDAFRQARERAGEQSLPIVVAVEPDSYAHVMDLPMFGSLVLITTDEPLGDELVSALEPLNEKLANACHSKRIETELREERDRFEAVFETIPEPLVNVVYDDGKRRIKRVNAAFEETFGDPETMPPEELAELLEPERTADSEPIDGPVDEAVPVTTKVSGRATDGVGDFLFRSAAVDSATDRTERFGLYVDITAERNRQRKLAQLSEATQDLLSEPDRNAVCQRATEAAEGVLGLPVTGIFVHERAENALVPVAVSAGFEDAIAQELTANTDRTGSLWETYRSAEAVTIDASAAPDCPLFGTETTIESGAMFPLGNHGVFVVGTPSEQGFDTTDRYFAGLLATLVETALDRIMREHGLEQIQETMQTVLSAETHQEVAETTVSQIAACLDLPFSGIWRYDARAGELVPVAVTNASRELLDEIPTFGAGDGILWDVYQSGETTIVDDVSTHPDAYNADSPLASEIIVPIGEYGVLATGSKLRSNFSQTERNLVEILAANVETAMELVDQRQELEVLDQVLARVLRHNIRNDLTVIQGHAREIARTATGETRTAAEKILRKSETLESTAERAHEMRTVVAQRGERTEMSLRRATVDAIAAVEDTYPDAEIETAFEGDPQVTAHPQVETAIEQVIENAVEHGAGSAVRVSIRVTEAAVVLEVADDGPGIEEMEIGVLERHGETALRHGSGVGLWITDRIVDYSDGTLAFETSDRGTTVTIRFE